MRVALVSPYSWTYPGGVTRHVDALARELLARGHEVRVLAPWDAPGRGARLAHRGVDAQALPRPEWLQPLGPTAGWPFNGAMSNLALGPGARGALRTGLRAFAPDVVHLHEPVAPWPCWDALADADAPLVGTFHTYGTSRLTHGFAALCGSQPRMRRLAVRIAVSEAAAWTGRSFYGGEYRVIPNGIHLEPRGASVGAAAGGAAGGAAAGGAVAGGAVAGDGPLRVVFVGRPEARKGLPVLLRAFEALRREVPATLELVGVETAASEADKAAALARADVLVAPSLGGESFGMVLLEAFAAGLPVVCSDLPGYRAVARHGVEALHVPPGDPAALGEALRELALDRPLLARLASAAQARAATFAWPTVTAAVERAYADALAAPAASGLPARPRRRATRALGAAPPGFADRRLPARLPRLEPAPPRRDRVLRVLRRGAAGAAALAVAVAAVVALHHVGVDELLAALARSSPGWTVLGLSVMSASLVLRAVAWRALLAAALPDRRVRLRDTYRATAIGVLMSATLPARLGEPARALLAARRLGDAGLHPPAPRLGREPRAVLPAVVGTLVGQTLLNVLALVLLGAGLLTTAGPWAGRGDALLLVAVPLLVVVLALVAAPRVAGRAGGRRGPRAAAAARIADRVRDGLRGFAHARLGPAAAAAQLLAWAMQWVACWALLEAVGLDLGERGAVAAAGVLLAVNVTAIVPVTPSNVGVFQAACVAVLTAYGARAGDALAYGIVLQAVELATAVVLGVPALVREGLGWRDVRARAVRGLPVRLGPRTDAGGP